MLAMHYRFELPDRDAIDAVDARVRERGPMFDGFPDMGHKWFLIDRETPCYAVFYLWHDAAGPTAFLDGPLFANLARTFGRPEVRLLLARRQPAATLRWPELLRAARRPTTTQEQPASPRSVKRPNAANTQASELDQLREAQERARRRARGED